MESAAKRARGGPGAVSARSNIDADESRQMHSDDDDVGAATSAIANAASNVVKQAKKAASSVTSEATERVQGLLDQQVDAGADLVGYLADSVRSAADELDKNAPQLAVLARDAAERIEGFSDAVRAQSAGELLQAGAAFARRRPAVVFGTAAILGFGLYRLFSATSADGRGRQDEERADTAEARRKPRKPKAKRRASQAGGTRGAHTHGS